MRHKNVFTLYMVGNSRGVQTNETCDEFRLYNSCQTLLLKCEGDILINMYLKLLSLVILK